MNCLKCGKEIATDSYCADCAPAAGQPQDAWGEILGTVALAGAVWLGGKIIAGFTGSGGASSRTAGPNHLPVEFLENRSRLSSEIPGEPAVSAQLELQKQMQVRQHNAEIGRMLMEHARTMNKITLGLKS